jgi:hypothetical protein
VQGKDTDGCAVQFGKQEGGFRLRVPNGFEVRRIERQRVAQPFDRVHAIA